MAAAAAPGHAAFVDIGFDVPLLGVSAVAWGDYDGDGDLDLVLTGSQNPPSPLLARALIFRNDAGAFTDINAGLTGLSQAALAWGDYDGDGDLDLVTCGDSDPDAPEVPTTRLYRNDGGAFTSLGAAGLPDIDRGDLAWGDYDNDGDLDVLVTGFYNVPANGILAAVYRNDGGTFVDAGVGLGAVFASSAAWGDYDADGDLDIALSGTTGSVRVASVYRNDAGTFTDIAAGLAGVSNGDLGWVDFDGDGDLDLMTTGDNGVTPSTALYRNNAGFTPVAAGFPGASRGFAWGDYDNDGDPDLALTGIGPTPSESRVYRNDGGAFVDIAAGLESARGCSPAWGDFDHDGDLDLLVAGGDFSGVRRIYRNTGVAANTPPSAPGNLRATACPLGEIAFSWDPSADAETPQAALTYNLRVGTTFGGNQVLTCHADVISGRRRVPADGNAGASTTHVLRLPPGTYSWSVQAVDAALEGSDFAPVRVVNGFVVDGAKDAGYGAALAVQGVQTAFGDNALGQVDFANGSELDEAFGRLDGCTLRLLLTGNLESNFNKLELFFDTMPGGQLRLRGDNPNVDFNGLNRMGDDGSGNGLTFDFAFEPDYWIGLTGGDTGGGVYRMFGNWAELLTTGGGVGRFLGGTGAGSDGVLFGGDNPTGILATVDNSNLAGVGAGTGAQSGAGVATGVELAIPLEAIGSPAGCFTVCAFVNGAAHDFVSNQVLGSLLPPHDSFGEPRTVDFSRQDGDQYFTVCPASAGVKGPAAPPDVRRLSVRPNPMRAVSLVRFELPAAGEATLEVFNVQGRRVRRVASGWFEAGPHQALWSGADDAGRALPSGVYFVRLEAAGEREVRRVALRR
jgi:hypothetical protein